MRKTVYLCLLSHKRAFPCRLVHVWPLLAAYCFSPFIFVFPGCKYGMYFFPAVAGLACSSLPSRPYTTVLLCRTVPLPYSRPALMPTGCYKFNHVENTNKSIPTDTASMKISLNMPDLFQEIYHCRICLQMQTRKRPSPPFPFLPPSIYLPLPFPFFPSLSIMPKCLLLPLFPQGNKCGKKMLLLLLGSDFFLPERRLTYFSLENAGYTGTRKVRGEA